MCHGGFYIRCILPGTSLSSALSSCGLGDEEDTEEEIARQVADLERELEEQDGMRSRLQEVYEAGAASLVKQSGEAGQIESLVESASREERRRLRRKHNLRHLMMLLWKML